MIEIEQNWRYSSVNRNPVSRRNRVSTQLTVLKERELANANICGATMSDGSRSDRTCQ
ncbi:MAG: hypothetical protein U7127_02260 [Phormidium sp.]